MADNVTSSTDSVNPGGIPNLEDVLKMLEEVSASGQLGVLEGEDAEGFRPRTLDEVGRPPEVEELGGQDASARVVEDAARRLEQSGQVQGGRGDGWSIEEELRKVEEEQPADVLQAGFEYPRVSSATEDFEVLSPEEEAAEFPDVDGDMLGSAIEGDPLAIEDGHGVGAGDHLELEEESVLGSRAGIGPVSDEVGSFVSGSDRALGVGVKQKTVADDKVSSAVADLLGADEVGVDERASVEGGGSEGFARVARMGGVNGSGTYGGSNDLVGFIREGLSGQEREVYDKLVASFEAEGRMGDATAYDFLLLCGFVATILRRDGVGTPAHIVERSNQVNLPNGKLAPDFGVLAEQIQAARDSFKEVRAVPEALVKLSASLEQMTKGTDYHLAEATKLHGDSLRKFNASIESVLKRFSEKVEKKRGLSVFSALWIGCLSLAAGAGLATLFEAVGWQQLKARVSADVLKEADARVEAFRKKVDQLQPERSILARLSEAGISLRAQPGEFTDLYNRERKAFIISLSSSGPQKVGKVDRDEKQSDIYFYEP